MICLSIIVIISVCTYVFQLTEVGAVIFGPIQTSILAHLEIEALPAEQPGHYAFQLWFYTHRHRQEAVEEKSNMLYILYYII